MIRALPEDPESERSLLATLALAGNEQWAISELPKLQESDFMVPAHKAVLIALRSLASGGAEINSLTLYAELDDRRLVGRVGGRSGLMDILNGEEVSRPDALTRILNGKRRQRELIVFGHRIVSEAETSDPSAVLDMAGSEISRMAQSSQTGNAESVDKFSDEALSSVVDRMGGLVTHGTKFDGWPRLNGLTHGFQPGQLIVLAARPGIGKTALALNWLLRARMAGKRSLIFSLEMGRSELWTRLVSDQGSVDYRDMIEQKNQDEFTKFGEAKMRIDMMPISVSDRGKITVPEMVAQMDREISRHGNLGFVVIDYLQLISSSEVGGKNQTETIRIGEITRSLKLAAKDRGVPILLLSQLNRESEKRGGEGKTGRPQLSDLRDSGCIEQDSDMVMFIHRQMTETTTELIIAKHRSGPCMTLPLTFIPKYTRYSENERDTGQNGAPAPPKYNPFDSM